MSTLIEQARAFRNALQKGLITMEDSVILEAPFMADNWKADTAYVLNAVVRYNNEPYRCLQAHTSQANWNPVSAPSLWAKILIQEGQILPWEQPSSTNPYMQGDKVTHKNKTYESLINNNVWEPGAVGSENLWKEV